MKGRVRPEGAPRHEDGPVAHERHEGVQESEGDLAPSGRQDAAAGSEISVRMCGEASNDTSDESTDARHSPIRKRVVLTARVGVSLLDVGASCSWNHGPWHASCATCNVDVFVAPVTVCLYEGSLSRLSENSYGWSLDNLNGRHFLSWRRFSVCGTVAEWISSCVVLGL